MPLPRIYVDFNNGFTDERDAYRVEIRSFEGKVSEHRLNHDLRPGMRVIVYAEDVEFEAELDFDSERNEWVGILDFATCKDIPWPFNLE